MARCRGCDELFGFAGVLSGAREPWPGRALARPPIPLPRRFAVEEGPPFRIVRRWLGPAAILLALLTVFWNGVLSVFLGLIVAGRIPLPVLAFLSLHLLAGLLLAYYTLCLFLNRTAVEVEGDRLRVRHWPLPWPGSRDLPVSELQQVWSRERVMRSRSSSRVTYEVYAALRSGAVFRLLAGLDAPEQALFVEQQLEARLGIRDQPVSGELAR